MIHLKLLYSVSIAAILSGIAFIIFATVFPMVISEIALMEEHLSVHRSEFNDMSNELWDEILQQSTIVRHARAVDRKRRQYGYSSSDYGESAEAGEGSSERQQGKKNNCPAGPKGPPGEPGERGEDGPDGFPGNNGYDGVAMQAASRSCTPCPAGPMGLPGYKGRRGLRGPKGNKGPQGPPGRDGIAGEEGTEGDRGYQGDQGPQGQRGPPGKEGVRGGKGPRGPKGETGPVGPEGDEGPPGERGDDARPGPQGETGPQGPPGQPGRPGLQGLQGKKGRKGENGEYCPCPNRRFEGAQNYMRNTNGRSGKNQLLTESQDNEELVKSKLLGKINSEGFTDNGKEAVKESNPKSDDHKTNYASQSHINDSDTSAINPIQSNSASLSSGGRHFNSDNQENANVQIGNNMKPFSYDKRARAAALRRKHRS